MRKFIGLALTVLLLACNNKPVDSVDSPQVDSLRRIIDSDTIDAVDKLRPRQELENILKNRPGTKAADFEMLLSDESRTSFYDWLEQDGRMAVMAFYSPECNECHSQLMALDSGIAQVSKNVRVLAVDILPDLPQWRRTLDDLPSEWTIAYAGHVTDDDTYIISSTPTLYLLHPDGTVALKEATVDEILEWH